MELWLGSVHIAGGHRDVTRRDVAWKDDHCLLKEDES